MVKTNWRWGTSRQTAEAIQVPVVRTRRMWQAGQKWRPLQVKATSFSCPQSGHWRRVNPAERSPQRWKARTVSAAWGGQRTVFLAVVFFVSVEELVPAVVDDLPEGRCPGAAGLVDGGHRILYL